MKLVSEIIGRVVIAFLEVLIVKKSEPLPDKNLRK
jgi:hypothetical protein